MSVRLMKKFLKKMEADGAKGKLPLKISQLDPMKGSVPASPKAKSSKDAKERNYDSHLSELFQNQEMSSIGGYMLGKTIGKGTYGEVKLGIHILTKQRVAVKIMNKTYGPLALREVQTWRYMRHPNIVQLYEIIVTESNIYLVMEYASRGEVFDHIVNKGKMKEKEARKIFSQLVNAVQYCHSKNFVHRDLKPENLLLDGNQNLKLIDFGFTRKCDPNKLLDTYCGSVCYVAPEIIKKEKYSGPESDVWSLGVILFALLCGRLPFDDESDVKIFEKVLALNYQIDESCSGAAQDLIRGILKINPKERYTTEQILSHPWFAEGETDCPESVMSNSNRIDGTDVVGDSELDLEIIQSMKKLGIDTEHLLVSLRNCQPDQLSALFFLLKKSNASPPTQSNDFYFPLPQEKSEDLEELSELPKSRRPGDKNPPLTPGRAAPGKPRRGSLNAGRLFGITEEHAEEEEEPKEPKSPPPRPPKSPRMGSSPNLREGLSTSLDQSFLKSVLDKPPTRPSSGSGPGGIMNFFSRKKDTTTPKPGHNRTASLDASTPFDFRAESFEQPAQIPEAKDGLFDHRNTSTKSDQDLIKEVLRVLAAFSISYQQEDYKFTIWGDAAKVAELSAGSRRAMDLDRESLSDDEEGMSTPRILFPPRVMENCDALDSSDEGARDSLDEIGEGPSEELPGSPSLHKTVKFELEICHIQAKLHGLRLKRLGGDVWLYKDFCDKLLSEFRLWEALVRHLP